MKVYYWNARKNFGDQLTSLLIKKFTHLDSNWVEPCEAELVVVGSILDLMPKNWNGVIAGAGKLHESTEVKFPNTKVLALRGPLTAKGLKGDFVLADPGLLADELVPNQDKKYELGLIPHWTDKTLENNSMFKRFNPKIIRVDDDPIKIITEIAQCKKIVSSALHGIILADAFDIPRRIELSPRMVSHPHQEGGIFKWRDYSESIGMKLEIGKTQFVDRNLIIEKQNELFDVFEEIKSIFLQDV